MTEPIDPRFDAPADEPGSRRVGNLSAALRSAERLGPLTRGEIAAMATPALVVIIAFLLPLPWIAQLVLAVGLGTWLGTEVAKRAIPRPVRRAIEAFGYLGEWELQRAQAFDASGIATPDAARSWLATHPEQPDDRWLRWELLLLADEPDEAAAVAARIPDDTPYDRFERAYAIDRVTWSQGGSSDHTELRALAEAVGPSSDEDRRHAEVAVAVAIAKDLAADGADPLPPLLAAREHLPAELGLGRNVVHGLRLLALVSSVVLSLAVSAAATLR